jgi:ABC-type dipeptide/oligopeptide/nickel transport system ATPase component
MEVEVSLDPLLQIHIGSSLVHGLKQTTQRGAVVSMLPQGAMNSVSPTKRIRHLIYDVMRSHESKISKEEALDRGRDRLTTLGLPARVLDAYPTSSRVA